MYWQLKYLLKQLFKIIYIITSILLLNTETVKVRNLKYKTVYIQTTINKVL